MDTLLENLKEKVQDRKTSEKILGVAIDKLNKDLTYMEDLEESRAIFQKAAQVTQSQLSERIATIVSHALAAVFENPYTFEITFVTRRNSTECDLKFKKNGKEYSPLRSCGFGVADIASLALRVAYWKMEKNSRNALILDEPLRALSLNNHERASMMLRELSRMKGGLQMIIVTHSEKMASYADKRFRIVKENGISHATEIEKEMI